MDVDWFPDGQRLASAGTDGLLILWDARTLQSVFSLHSDKPIESISWSRDGLELATHSRDGSAWVLDATTSFQQEDKPTP